MVNTNEIKPDILLKQSSVYHCTFFKQAIQPRAEHLELLLHLHQYRAIPTPDAYMAKNASLKQLITGLQVLDSQGDVGCIWWGRCGGTVLLQLRDHMLLL